MSDTTILYLSHSAGRHDNPDWWIVEPRDDARRLRPQVESLLDAGRGRRRVLQLAIWDEGGQLTELTALPDEMQSRRLDEMRYRGRE